MCSKLFNRKHDKSKGFEDQDGNLLTRNLFKRHILLAKGFADADAPKITSIVYIFDFYIKLF